MVQWLVGLRRNSKAPPKTKLAPKNGHGHCLMVCCPSDPLQLSESWQTITSENYAQQMNEMQHLQLALVNRTGRPSPQQHPTTRQTTNTSQLNELDYKVLPHPPYSPDLSPTNFLFFKDINFCRQNTPTTSRRQQMLSKSLSNPEAWIFMLQEQTNLFLVVKVLIVNSSYFNLKICI